MPVAAKVAMGIPTSEFCFLSRNCILPQAVQRFRENGQATNLEKSRILSNLLEYILPYLSLVFVLRLSADCILA
jgi:hypothetical protein